jgi:hypothetical protein
VLNRPGFVEAAPALPGDPRLRLPPASPHRRDGKEMDGLSPHPKQQRLVAHTNRRHMIGDHHGRGAGRATPLVRAVDTILGTYSSSPLSSTQVRHRFRTLNR